MERRSASGVFPGRAWLAWLRPDDGGPKLADAAEDAAADLGAIDVRSRRVLWISQLYTGMVGSVGAGGAGLFYVFRTWEAGPNRPWIALVGILAIVQALTVWSCRRYFVTDRQRAHLFIAWNVLSYVLIAIAVALDGGIGSPIAMAWVLPVIYLLMGFSRRAIVFCGSTGIALYFLVAQLTPGPLNFAALVLQVVVLVDAVFMVLLGAMAREQREGVLAAVRTQLSILATTDSLTGCLNQPEFTRVTTAEVERAVRCRYPVAMLAIDVDHFKVINDTHGHLTGDDVLGRLGSILRAGVRRTDSVGRIGGDELAVLCPETDLPEATELAERLRSAARGLSVGTPVTLSIGISLLGRGETDPQPLRERADLALYDAKRKGRDRYVVFDPDAWRDGLGAAPAPRRAGLRAP